MQGEVLADVDMVGACEHADVSRFMESAMQLDEKAMHTYIIYNSDTLIRHELSRCKWP